MELVEPRRLKIAFWIINLALFAAWTLSIVSYLDLCTEECKAGHDWLLFGFSFGPVGILAFSGLLLLNAATYFYPYLRILVALSLALALGGEVVLILIQQYKIGHFCPVCLGIAASLGIAGLAMLIPYGQKLYRALKYEQKGVFMKCLKTGVLTTLAFGAGILLFSFGVVKENKLAAMENSVKEQMIFGNPNASVSVYLFTDWACPACRALEPKLHKLIPVITSKANFTFVDIAVHPETLNYSPYNLSFMINNKNKYLELRDALTRLSTKTGTPTDAEIEQIAKRYHTQFKELNYADIALGLKYWKELGKQFNIDATPTLVIVNPTTKKGKKISGMEEINEKNILNAINKLQ